MKINGNQTEINKKLNKFKQKINYIGINLTCHGRGVNIEDDITQNGRRPHPKWKTTSPKMEDDQNGRQPKWNMTKMEDNQNRKRQK